MSVGGDEDLEGLRAAGRVVADALAAMRARVVPGVTTAELDRAGAEVFAAAGARSGPNLAYGFPGSQLHGAGARDGAGRRHHA